MLAVFKKEMRSYFTSFIGYIVLAVFFAIASVLFSTVCLISKCATLQPVFNPLFLIVSIITPILTMRLLSDEKRCKTDQLLFTSPVKLSSVVFGKYLASLVMYLICMLIFLVYALIISSLGAYPGWGSLFGSLLGAFLLGATFLSIGIFFSSITENQIIAAICGILTFIVFSLVDSLVKNVSFLYKIVNSISFMNHYENFVNGIINFSDCIFFLSVSALFLYLTIHILERKRWR